MAVPSSRLLRDKGPEKGFPSGPLPPISVLVYGFFVIVVVIFYFVFVLVWLPLFNLYSIPNPSKSCPIHYHTICVGIFFINTSSVISAAHMCHPLDCGQPSRVHILKKWSLSQQLSIAKAPQLRCGLWTYFLQQLFVLVALRAMVCHTVYFFVRSALLAMSQCLVQGL